MSLPVRTQRTGRERLPQRVPSLLAPHIFACSTSSGPSLQLPAASRASPRHSAPSKSARPTISTAGRSLAKLRMPANTTELGPWLPTLPVASLVIPESAHGPAVVLHELPRELAR